MENLVDRLRERHYIKSDKVEEAFQDVDRAVFLPERYEMSAYEDRPLPIGEDETISAPHMVAISTEVLDLEPDNRVLEVGSGSGYQAAILGKLAGKVIGVEINEELVEKSRKNLEEAEIENVEIIQGSGLKPVKVEFDRILFSCAIPPKKFEEAKKILAEEGILVAPVGENRSQIMKKFQEGKTTKHGKVRFVSFKEEG